MSTESELTHYELTYESYSGPQFRELRILKKLRELRRKRKHAGNSQRG
jgi:hypothetical protein